MWGGGMPVVGRVEKNGGGRRTVAADMALAMPTLVMMVDIDDNGYIGRVVLAISMTVSVIVVRCNTDALVRVRVRK